MGRQECRPNDTTQGSEAGKLLLTASANPFPTKAMDSNRAIIPEWNIECNQRHFSTGNDHMPKSIYHA
jgi:hypothetical protein